MISTFSHMAKENKLKAQMLKYFFIQRDSVCE